jgi:hypothetical protein
MLKPFDITQKICFRVILTMPLHPGLRRSTFIPEFLQELL